MTRTEPGNIISWGHKRRPVFVWLSNSGSCANALNIIFLSWSFVFVTLVGGGVITMGVLCPCYYYCCCQTGVWLVSKPFLCATRETLHLLHHTLRALFEVSKISLCLFAFVLTHYRTRTHIFEMLFFPLQYARHSLLQLLVPNNHNRHIKQHFLCTTISIAKKYDNRDLEPIFFYFLLFLLFLGYPSHASCDGQASSRDRKSVV